MEKRYFIQMAYNGTRFCGWQIQPNAESVQGILTHALQTQLNQTISVTGAGRTDTGVHASFFIAHFDTIEPIKDTNQLCYKLNSMLPFDIQLVQIFEVQEEMHARFSAITRTYCYYISRNKDPFRKEFTAYIPHDLNIARMNEAAKTLFEYNDFTSFSKLHTDVKTNNCSINKAEWRSINGLLVFDITADRFLRNMVRAIVGTMILVGRNKVSVEGFRQIIESKDRGKAGASAPAKGLFLSDIQYPEPENTQLERSCLFF